MTAWAPDIPEMSLHDHRAILQHINLISHRAWHNDFLDSAHVEYDVSVRKMAETVGFEAFTSSNTGSSVLHYGAQNMWVKKAVTGMSDIKRCVLGGKASKACSAWNSEQG